MKSQFGMVLLVGLLSLGLTASSLKAEDAKSESKAEAKPAAKTETKAEAKSETATTAEGEALPWLSLSGGVQYVTMNGDEKRFRQDWWIKDGWTGGIEELSFERKFGQDILMQFHGRGLWTAGDYELGMDVTKKDVGFLRAGFTNYRKWFDDTGGFYRRFLQDYVRSQSLDRELYLDIGDIFVEGGLRAPNLPEITVGYERKYKHGEKSMVEWGSVTQTGLTSPPLPSGSVTKKIYPAMKEIDEIVDIVRVNVEHDIKNIHIADEFRWEHYRNDTTRLDDAAFTFNAAGIRTAEKDVTVWENFGHDAFFNTLYADTHLTDWAYLSVGYLASALKGEASYNMDTVAVLGPLAGTDKFWRSHGIRLDEDSNVVNANLMLGPFANFTLYGGLQGEATNAQMRNRADLFEVAEPTLEGIADGYRDKDAFEGKFGVRFTGLPWTTLYTEASWARQDINLFERQLEREAPEEPFEVNFERLTDTNVERQIYTVGMTTSPIKGVTFSGQYRRKVYDNDYNPLVDLGPGEAQDYGYSAFIEHQTFGTNELALRTTWRPLPKLSLSFKYQMLDTDIETTHNAIPTLNIPRNTLRSGNYKRHIYTAGATWTPISRMYLTGQVSFQDVLSDAFDNDSNAVIRYRGNVVSVLGTVGYLLDKKTDLTLNYIMSTSANFKNNGSDQTPPAGYTSSDYGLPLGLDYQQHGVMLGLTHRVNPNMQIGLNWGLYVYDENSNRHINDYIANLMSANLKLRF